MIFFEKRLKETFWLEILFLAVTMIISGKFYVDPKIMTAQVEGGQKVIWSVNNPYYDLLIVKPILRITK